MAACSLDTLISDAVTNRFTGLPDDLYRAAILQLLYEIQGMSGTIDTIIADAVTNRFTGLTPDRWEAALLQLACDISNAGGGGSGSVISGNYNNDPLNIPAPAVGVTAAVAYDLDPPGQMWKWDGAAWV